MPPFRPCTVVGATRDTFPARATPVGFVAGDDVITPVEKPVGASRIDAALEGTTARGRKPRWAGRGTWQTDARRRTARADRRPCRGRPPTVLCHAKPVLRSRHRRHRRPFHLSCRRYSTQDLPDGRRAPVWHSQPRILARDQAWPDPPAPCSPCAIVRRRREVECAAPLPTPAPIAGTAAPAPWQARFRTSDSLRMLHLRSSGLQRADRGERQLHRPSVHQRAQRVWLSCAQASSPLNPLGGHRCQLLRHALSPVRTPRSHHDVSDRRRLTFSTNEATTTSSSVGSSSAELTIDALRNSGILTVD